MAAETRPGPLAGLRIVEFAAIGPAPFAVMLLADLGAEVMCIRRADAPWPELPLLSRGRASITLDLKSDEDRETALRIANASDILIEGFRPGVMERLHLGPDLLLKENSRLIYGRMTGWGQDGPLAQTAGHDLNFIGLTGLLAVLQHQDRPRAPQNLLGDYAGGALYLVMGILAALHERQRSGLGQVIDAAIVDGAVSLLTPILGMMAAQVLPADPAKGILAGDSLFYRTYRCADGHFVAVGALEPQFRRVLAEQLDVSAEVLESPQGAAVIEALFASRSRDAWIEFFSGCDCCLSPVLDMDEATRHPHLVARNSFIVRDGETHPAPAPRFSRTPAALPGGAEARRRLRDWRIAPAGALG